MVVTAATLNSLQALLLVKYGWANYGISQYLKAGAWVSHLWFMINLLIYHIVAYVSIVWFAKGTQVARRAAVRLMSSLPLWTWLVLLPLLNVLAVMIAHFLPGPGVWSMGALDPRSLLYYFPFFAIGALLHERRALLLRFCAMRSFRIAVWFVISSPLASASQDWLDGMLLGATTVYLEALTAWAGVALCFNVFSLAARATTPLTRTLSDASYTVYLFHHLLVIIFGLMMINLRIGGVLGLLALVTVVVTTALMIHRYVISPYRVMRFLFNGK